MDAHTPDAMTTRRAITDSDIHEYTTYVAKLAAITTPGDPPPIRFRTRFLWTHGTLPQDDLIHDQNAALFLRNQAPAA
jgi:hypothetical protein